MLPQNRRLSGKQIKNEIFKKHKKVNSKYYSLVITEGEKNEPTRFAVVISAKVAKKAVNRNRIKRRLFNIIRGQLPDIKSGLKIIILTKIIINIASQKELMKFILNDFAASGIIEKEKEN